MQVRITLFFLFLTVGVRSQEIRQYEHPKTIPEKYSYNPSEDFVVLTKLKVKGATSVDVNNYAEMVAYNKSELFENGQVYLGWEEMENYLEAIKDKILPDNINSKIFLVKNPSYNAFTIHDGSLFINIGLFADVYNEAGLAIIIGHELAHFINQDVQNSYFKNFKKFSKKNRNKSQLKIEYFHENQEIELNADSLGFALANSGGYNIAYGLNNFYHFLLGENPTDNKKVRIVTVDSKKDSLRDINKILISTHPEAKERISFLEKQLKSSSYRDNKKDFLISESIFLQLQEKSRYEVLLLHLNNNDYQKCIEKAFEYYLLYPENEVYTYYILEGIRRILYLDDKKGENGFLTDNFREYFGSNEGILSNLKFLVRDSLKYNNIKATELISDEKPFSTYSEAFVYFENQAIKMNIKESYLTLAIHYRDSVLFDSYLKKYLSFPNILHRNYAENLLKKSLKAEIENNTLSVSFFNDIIFLEDHFYGYHNRLIQKKEKSKEYYISAVQTLNKKFPDKLYCLTRSVQDTSLKDFVAINEFINKIDFFGTFLREKKNNKASEYLFFDDEELSEYQKNSIYILAPEVWNYLEDNNYNSIESFDIINFDDQTAIINTIGNTLLNIALIPFGVIYQGGKIGSNRYAYHITYKRYDSKKEVISNNEKDVHYQMRKPHLNNTLYQLINNDILNED